MNCSCPGITGAADDCGTIGVHAIFHSFVCHNVRDILGYEFIILRYY